MIKIHNSPALAIALICCALVATTAFAQNKEADDYKVDPSKTKTSQSTEGDNQITKTDQFNKKGVLLSSYKTTVTPEGTITESETYENGKLTFKKTTRTDNFGKETGSQVETYNRDGTLRYGEISELKPGDTHLTIVKKYDDKQQKYVDVPLEEQQKRAEELQKFEENLKKYRKLGENLWELRRSGKVLFKTSGTGETIGHVVDVTVQNLSNESLNFYFPPTIAESKSSKYQDFATRGQDVALRPSETKTISVMGTCLEKNKPPEPPGQTGDIVLDDGDPTTRTFDWYKTTPEIVTNILRIVEAKYEAADKLEGEGRFKDFPYKDKQKCKDIVVQHSTWGDPRISDAFHSPPEDKEDFKKNIDDQAKEHGPITRDVRKQLDKGTNIMWDTIELADEKAKDLEQPEQPPGNTFQISDEKGDKTEEKKTPDEKRKDAKQKKDDWKAKQKLRFLAFGNMILAQQKYNNALVKFCQENNKDYKDLRDKRDQAGKKAKEWEISPPTKKEQDAAQKDKEAFKQADEAFKKVEAECEKEFQKTDEGKKDLENLNEKKEALSKAEASEKEAKDAYKKADAEAYPKAEKLAK
jgi:hypothetical protein